MPVIQELFLNRHNSMRFKYVRILIDLFHRDKQDLSENMRESPRIFSNLNGASVVLIEADTNYSILFPIN